MKSNTAFNTHKSYVNFLIGHKEINNPAPVTGLYQEVLLTLKNQWEIPGDMITVREKDGWIILDGKVPWSFQRDAANSAIQDLPSVKGVINNLYVVSQARDDRDKATLEAAFLNSALLQDNNIQISVTDREVTLSGSVQSQLEKNEAERIAWTIPGIYIVDNDIDTGK